MILSVHYAAAVLMLTFVALTGNSQSCLPPDESTIRSFLQFILASESGEGALPMVQSISQYRFTCMAVGDSIGRFRHLSIAVRYNFSTFQIPTTSQVSQFQLQCNGESFSVGTDGIEMNPPENAFNTSRRDCFVCASSGPPGLDTVANCFPCSDACLGVGQGGCTASVSTCCPYYDGADGTCITSCTSNVIKPDFICSNVTENSSSLLTTATITDSSSILLPHSTTVLLTTSSLIASATTQAPTDDASMLLPHSTTVLLTTSSILTTSTPAPTVTVDTGMLLPYSTTVLFATTSSHMLVTSVPVPTATLDSGPIQPSDVDIGSGDSESDLFVITSTEVSVTMTPTPEVILFCDPENTTTEQFGSYSWPETAVEKTVQLPCVFRPGYNASRTCTQGGSWVAVDVTNCRIIRQPIMNFTLYMRFSSLLRDILPSQNIQGALRSIENVVLQQVNITTFECKNVSRRAVDTERDRVECIIVGPDDPQDQALSPSTFLNQVTVVLRANNFSVSETEISSGLGYCDYEITTTQSRGMFQWNETSVSNTASTTCFYGPDNVVLARQCESRLTWAPPSVDQCRTVVSEQFTNIQQVNISSENVNEVISNVTSIVTAANQTSDQNSENLRVVADVLTQSVNAIQNVSEEVARQATTNAVEILDSVEEWPMEVVQEQSNMIVQAFDNIVDTLIESDNFTNISIVERDLALTGERINREQFQGLTLSVGQSDSDQLQLETSANESSSEDLPQNLNAAFSLPQGILSNIQAGRTVSVAFTVYNSTALFPVRNTSQDTAASSTVVGSQVVSVQVGGVADGAILEEPVVFQLRLLNTRSLVMNEFVANRRCVFWDFNAANGAGDWSTGGCNLTSFNNNTNVVGCQCDHLTNFACLVDISIRIQSGENVTVLPREFLLALDITTYVGVSLSLIGLILLLLTYLVFKEFRQKDVTKFHVQLALSMILMLIVFVAGINRVENRPGCITVGVLLHYLILVTWMWMAAEAVLLFQKLVIVFKKPSTLFIVIFSIVCWACPLLPVVISVSINPDFYITESNATRDFCFIGNTGVFFGGFLAPIILIIILNVCIFISSTYVVIRLKLKQEKRNQARQGSQIRKKFPMSSKDSCKLLALLAGFMFLLGLSWIILLFTVIGTTTSIYASFAIQWLFNFFNSLQGFFLFVFFVALNRDARKLWFIHLCPCLKGRKSRYSTRYKHSSTSGNTASTKVTSTNYSSGTLQSAVKKHKFNEELTLVNTSITLNEEEDEDTEAPNILVNENALPNKRQPEIRLKRSSTVRKTHDIETAEVIFFESEDEEDSPL